MATSTAHGGERADGQRRPRQPADTRATQTLLAIGKARLWIKEITDGTTVAAIARREDKSERQIRLLAPLAFVPPKMVTGIISRTGSPQTVTNLAGNVPLYWLKGTPAN